MRKALIANPTPAKLHTEAILLRENGELFTSQPLKKARSSIGADCGSGLTRPLLSD